MKQITIDKEGIYVVNYFKTVIILPQIAKERGWNTVDTLSECCMNAGLLADSWMKEDIRIYKVSVEVFEELEPKGEVKQII